MTLLCLDGSIPAWGMHDYMVPMACCDLNDLFQHKQWFTLYVIWMIASIMHFRWGFCLNVNLIIIISFQFHMILLTFMYGLCGLNHLSFPLTNFLIECHTEDPEGANRSGLPKSDKILCFYSVFLQFGTPYLALGPFTIY